MIESVRGLVAIRKDVWGALDVRLLDQVRTLYPFYKSVRDGTSMCDAVHVKGRLALHKPMSRKALVVLGRKGSLLGGLLKQYQQVFPLSASPSRR